MKRMTENAIGYYTVTKDDIKNITSQSPTLFKYTPSPEFIEAVHNFKSVLRVDWYDVAENIAHAIGSPLSVLYPVNKVFITDEGDIAYSYSASSIDTKQINPSFYEINGEYFISWNGLSN